MVFINNPAEKLKKSLATTLSYQPITSLESPYLGVWVFQEKLKKIG
jgi:hypothetical protein